MIYYRQKEIEKIKRIIDNDGFATILLYGQQGVGKTTVLKAILENTSATYLYFDCKKVSSFINLELLERLINDTFKTNNHFNVLKEALEFLLEKSINQKTIVIFDEFTNLFDDELLFDATLAETLDKYREKSEMKMIFASSSKVALIERLINFSGKPFSHLSYTLHLKPLDYLQASNFYPNYSASDKVKMYSVFGGLPSVNNLIDPTKSADQNIIDLIIKPGSEIEKKIIRMIQSETSRAGSLNDLLYIISKGYTKYKDINNIISNNNGTRPDYLVNRLIDLNIINKTSPINDLNNAKRMNYEINDNLINFYYRYIFSNPFGLTRNQPKKYFEKYVKEDLETKYIPYIFDSIIKEFLYQANLRNTNDYLNLYIGPFLASNKKTKQIIEFNVATYNKNGYTIYLTKYSKDALTNAEIQEKIAKLNELKVKNYRLGLISSSGLSDDIDQSKFIIYSIDNLYELTK